MQPVWIRWSAVAVHGIALTAVTTTLSMAQAPEGGRRPEGGRGGFMRNIPVVAAIDADGDGTITAEEIDGASKALKALDKNGDGKLSDDETRPSFGGGPGGPGGFGGAFGGGSPEAMVNRIMESDKNKDGKLAKDELSERMQPLFDRADADKDGFVTKEELTKSLPQGGGFAPPGGGPGGPGGRGPGGPGGGGNPTAFIDRMFEFDADKDGKLSREELTKMMEQGGGRGPGRGPGGEGGNRRPPTE
jgi:Ca2+-binding EF-hand superfamily protein